MREKRFQYLDVLLKVTDFLQLNTFKNKSKMFREKRKIK